VNTTKQESTNCSQVSAKTYRMSDAALILNGWQINFRNRNLFSNFF